MRPLLLIPILALFSCKNDPITEAAPDKVIRIDLDHLTTDDLPALKIRSLIPLETSDSSIIGSVSSLELHDGRIYILDMFKTRALMAFSDSGAFIGKTKYGKGPGEMINPFSLYLDKGSNSVYVWDQGLLSILHYNSDLDFLDQEAFGNPLSNFAILENGRKLVHTHYHGDFAFKVFGPDHETVEQEFIPDLQYGWGVGLGRSISVYDRTLLITPYQYYVYELKDSKVDTAYFFDFGKYKLTKEDIEDPERSDLSKIQQLVAEGKRVHSPHYLSEGSSFLTFCSYFKSEALSFAYSFQDQKAYFLNGYFEKNLLPKCSVRGITSDDVFYATVDPEDLDDFQQATGGQLVDGEVNLEGNPYLVTFTLGTE